MEATTTACLHQARLKALEGARVQPCGKRAVQWHALQQPHEEVAEKLHRLSIQHDGAPRRSQRESATMSALRERTSSIMRSGSEHSSAQSTSSGAQASTTAAASASAAPRTVARPATKASDGSAGA